MKFTNVLFISPNFPPNYYNFVVALAKNNAKVLGIAECEYSTLSDLTKQALSDFIYVPNLESYEDVYQVVKAVQQKHGKIDVVESHNEHWLSLEAKIREDFGIDGPKLSDLDRIKKKSAMKKIFQDLGINVGKWRLLKANEEYKDLYEFAKSSNFPLFAKPDVGVGAHLTYKINNFSELINFYNTKTNIDYVIEEFFYGKIITFDGLCDELGNIIYCVSHFSPMGCYETLNNKLDLYYYSLRSIPKDVYELGSKIIKNMRISNKFFHLEFLINEEKKHLYPLEVNWRPPGGYTLDVMNYTSDIDLYQIWADLVCKKIQVPINLEYSYKYHAAYVSRRYDKMYKLSKEEILRKYSESILFHTEMPKIFSPLMGDYGFIIRNSELSELLKIIEDIQKHY